MATVLLSTLISDARSSADMPVDGFVTDAEVTRWVNEGLQQLHRFLVDAFETEYAFKTEAVSFVTGTEEYALPEDFYRLYGIDLNLAGRYYALQPYTFAERNRFRNSTGPSALWYNVRNRLMPRYAIIRSASDVPALRVLPSNFDATGTILYAPTVVTLVDGSDGVDLPDGWERYASTYAAIRMLMKEESSTTELQKLIDRWDRELVELRDTRDAAFPKKVVDMDRVNFDELGFP